MGIKLKFIRKYDVFIYRSRRYTSFGKYEDKIRVHRHDDLHWLLFSPDIIVEPFFYNSYRL